MSYGYQMFVIVDTRERCPRTPDAQPLYWTGTEWSLSLYSALPYSCQSSAQFDLHGLKASDRSLVVRHCWWADF